MFENETSGINARVEDRPARPIPHSISSMAEMPWLASRFDPNSEATRPSIKNKIASIVSTGIPITGGLIILGALIAFGYNLFSLYS